jgi:membrane-bound lytic murein transglycosylase D
MRSGFQLDGQNHRFVRPYIDWYAKHQAYLDRVAERARPFLYDIVQEIEARGMPMEIALLPIVESAFQPFAYSPGRAAGIWQFIPATGKHYGLKQNWWYDGRRDVPKATTAALDYLERLAKRFDGDWLLALASYNSGEGRVARAVKKNKKKGKPTDFWSLDLPKETEGYVPKLLAISAIVQNRKAHGITLTSIPDEPYLEQVDIGSQIDLALAAELAELPIETMYQLNPAYNRWATDPKGPHRLLLPIHKADAFREALTKVDKKNRVRWERHRIREGETLGHIARKFQTSCSSATEV